MLQVTGLLRKDRFPDACSVRQHERRLQAGSESERRAVKEAPCPPWRGHERRLPGHFGLPPTKDGAGAVRLLLCKERRFDADAGRARGAGRDCGGPFGTIDAQFGALLAAGDVREVMCDGDKVEGRPGADGA